jgi:small subunit ribosomal protein S3
LHTLRADIDYALAESLTKTGLIGVKVWICKGMVYGNRDLSPNVGQKQGRGGKQGGGGGRGRGRRK